MYLVLSANDNNPANMEQIMKLANRLQMDYTYTGNLMQFARAEETMKLMTSSNTVPGMHSAASVPKEESMVEKTEATNPGVAPIVASVFENSPENNSTEEGSGNRGTTHHLQSLVSDSTPSSLESKTPEDAGAQVPRSNTEFLKDNNKSTQSLPVQSAILHQASQAKPQLSVQPTTQTQHAEPQSNEKASKKHLPITESSGVPPQLPLIVESAISFVHRRLYDSDLMLNKTSNAQQNQGSRQHVDPSMRLYSTLRSTQEQMRVSSDTLQIFRVNPEERQSHKRNHCWQNDGTMLRAGQPLYPGTTPTAQVPPNVVHPRMVSPYHPNPAQQYFCYEELARTHEKLMSEHYSKMAHLQQQQYWQHHHIQPQKLQQAPVLAKKPIEVITIDDDEGEPSSKRRREEPRQERDSRSTPLKKSTAGPSSKRSRFRPFQWNKEQRAMLREYIVEYINESKNGRITLIQRVAQLLGVNIGKVEGYYENQRRKRYHTSFY